MGEAKRRQQQNTNLRKSTPKTQMDETLRYVNKTVADIRRQQPYRNAIHILLTNKDKGYDPDFIEEFKLVIRDYQFPCQVSILMLPRQYASLPPSYILEKLVEVY